MEVVADILTQSWNLVRESALFLLLGFTLAGLIHGFVPVHAIVRWLGPAKFRSVITAAAVGTPLPLCSCSVVPVAASLRRNGASKGATTAFLISTPESGADSIAVTYALMDPIMTVARPVSAMLTAMTAGIAQNLWGGRERPDEVEQASAAEAASCCGATPQPAAANARAAVEKSCCTSESSSESSQVLQDRAPARMQTCCAEPSQAQESAAGKPPFNQRLRRGLRYGWLDMFEDLGVYLVIGFLLAGVLGVVLQQYDPLRAALGSAWAPLLMLAAGIPLYVCAAAATPIVAVLIGQGLAPGAGLVFLLAGPATNAASLVLLNRILGRRALVLYLISIGVCALGAGYLLDGIYAWSGIAPAVSVGAHEGHESAGPLHTAAAVVLSALVVLGVYRRYRRGSPVEEELSGEPATSGRES